MSFPETGRAHSGIGFETYTAKNGVAVGLRAEVSDGRIFRFTEMGGTVGVANKMYEAGAGPADWDTMAVQAAVAAGASAIPYTNGGSTALVADDLENGYIIVESAAALGHAYNIKSHGAAATGATVTATLDDNQTVQAALTTSHKVTVSKNLYKDVVITPDATGLSNIAGVPSCIIAADTWGWVQTKGVCSCLLVGTVVLANPLILGANAGSIGPAATQTTTATTIVGYCIEVAPTTDFGLVRLVLE